MGAPNLLLTGSTGYLGFRTLVDALEAGYSVRAAVRSKARAEATILNTPSIKALSPGDKLEFVEVPDITSPDAFKTALEGITYVVHIASPLPSGKIPEPFEETMIKPAVEGTLSILNSALSVPSVKRVVITSSVMANMNPAATTTPSAKDRLPTPAGPFPDVRTAYRASKAAALNATDDFITKHNPQFTIVNILPSYITGRNELASPDDINTFLSQTAAFPIAHLVQPELYSTAPIFGAAVFVDDVAQLHVNALDSNRVPSHASFYATVDVEWRDTFEIAKKLFPKAVQDGVFKQAERPTLNAPGDNGDTEKVLGRKLASLEDMIRSSAEGYFKLIGRKAE